MNVNVNRVVSWQQWKQEKINLADRRDGTGVEFITRVTMPVKYTGSLEELIDTFNTELSNKGFRHLYLRSHQMKSFIELKGKLDKESCILLIDYAENYGCKFHKETQGMHFGASRDSATIHDGVLYTLDSVGKLQAESFATISNCQRHDPVAVWAYLKPVISWALEKHSGIKRIHFQSDGPATQYKSKYNFYQFSTQLYDNFPGQLEPEGSTWLFSAAGHGKNAADGVGATLKHAADKMVARGEDIPDARTMYEKLDGQTKVKLFFVPASEVTSGTEPPKLDPLEGTMKVHQIDLIQRGTIQHRQMACFCSYPEICKCHCPKRHSFVNNTVVNSIDHNNNDDGDGMEVNRYCIVLYDDAPYVGKIIQTLEDVVEVTVLYQRGENKFVWPTTPDTLLYAKEDVLYFIGDPTEGKRFLKLDPKDWEKFTTAL